MRGHPVELPNLSACTKCARFLPRIQLPPRAAATAFGPDWDFAGARPPVSKGRGVPNNIPAYESCRPTIEHAARFGEVLRGVSFTPGTDADQ
jgi:hypothetical protein